MSNFKRLQFLFSVFVLLILARPAVGGVNETPPPIQLGGTPLPTATAAPKDFEWDASLGLSQYLPEVKGGCWYPVWIEIKANTAAVRSRVTITQAGNPLRVEAQVDVAKGARKIYRTYYRPSGPQQFYNQANLEVKLEASPIGSASIPLSHRYAEPGSRQILILCDETGPYNFLNVRKSESSGDTDNSAPPSASTMRYGSRGRAPGRPAPSRTGYGTSYPAPVVTPAPGSSGLQSVIYGRPELIPEDAIGLEGIDVMLIDTPHVRSLTPEQWGAIRGWVAAGGQLMLATGRNQPFIQQSPLKDPFGVLLPEPAAVLLADVFGSGTGGSLVPPNAESVLACWAQPPGGAWDAIYIGDSAHPFVAARRVGRGWFTVCAAALDRPILELLKAQPHAANFHVIPAPPPAATTPLLNFNAVQEATFWSVLQRGFAMNLADVTWVIKYLFLYNLLAMPLNWWICRRWLRRPGLAWPILVLTAIFFAAYGYSSALERQNQNLQFNEVTFVSRPAAEGPAQAVALTTLFTPRRLRGDELNAAVRYFPSRPPLSEREQTEPLTLNFDRATDLGNLTVYPWEVLNLRSNFVLENAGSLRAEWVPTGDDRVGLRLTNNTPYNFRNWRVLQGTNYLAGAQVLSAGTSITLEREHTTEAPLSQIVSDMVFPAIDRAFPQQPDPSGAVAVSAPPPQVDQSSFYHESPEQIMREPLFFFGETSALASPFSQSMPSQKYVGLVFYEQELDILKAQPQGGYFYEHLQEDAPNLYPPQLSVPFTVRKVVNGEDPINSPAPKLESPNTEFMIAMDTTATLELSFMKSRNEIPNFRVCYDYRNQYGWGSADGQFRYHSGGCPVEVYNFASRRWERKASGGDSWFPLDPATNYVHPSHSAIYVRFSPTTDKLKFWRTDTKSRRRDMRSYREIFIKQNTPFNTVTDPRMLVIHNVWGLKI